MLETEKFTKSISVVRRIGKPSGWKMLWNLELVFLGFFREGLLMEVGLRIPWGTSVRLALLASLGKTSDFMKTVLGPMAGSFPMTMLN